MLTAGDIEFEPEQPKILPLTTSIALMLAGDSAMQREILQGVFPEIAQQIKAEPKNWWNVRDVADRYVHHFNEARLRRAENAILAPLGLNRDSFVSRQREMGPQLVERLATELKNFQVPTVETIFAGNDATGPHIYVAYDGEVNCLDAVGFAAIGSGSCHANSELMFARHTVARQFAETLLLVYSAKKRAEAAPGVGIGTDMFTIGPLLGSYKSIEPHVLEGIEKIYQTTQKANRKAIQRAEQSAKTYMDEISRASATTKEQATEVKAASETSAEVKPTLVDPRPSKSLPMSQVFYRAHRIQGPTPDEGGRVTLNYIIAVNTHDHEGNDYKDLEDRARNAFNQLPGRIVNDPVNLTEISEADVTKEKLERVITLHDSVLYQVKNG
jgi:hypothetical protein